MDFANRCRLVGQVFKAMNDHDAIKRIVVEWDALLAITCGSDRRWEAASDFVKDRLSSWLWVVIFSTVERLEFEVHTNADAEFQPAPIGKIRQLSPRKSRVKLLNRATMLWQYIVPGFMNVRAAPFALLTVVI